MQWRNLIAIVGLGAHVFTLRTVPQKDSNDSHVSLYRCDVRSNSLSWRETAGRASIRFWDSVYEKGMVN